MAHLVLVRPGFVPPASTYPLPRCHASGAQTICLCGGLLGYVRGEWHHVDFCLECLTAPARRSDCKHEGCPTPEPVRCAHEVDWRCDEPADLVVGCARGYEDQTCCGCCWIDAGTDMPRRVHQ
jgi:hypothetical protein